MARLATVRASGDPDVAVAGFSLDDDDIVSGGLDLTKTVHSPHLQTNPRASVVIDDLVAADPFTPRGIKIRVRRPANAMRGLSASASLRRLSGVWRINQGATTHFAGSVEKRPAVPG
jgi:hypothetical protein